MFQRRVVLSAELKYLTILMFMCFLKTVAYKLPEIKLEALTPSGLRVSMPDDGFKSFNFIGYLKRDLSSKEVRFFVPAPKNGFWVAVDKNLDLNIGENITFSAVVIKNSQQLQKYGFWVVNEFVSREETPVCETSETKIPSRKKICTGSLIFEEEFNDANTLNWHKENMFPQEPDYPFNAYLADMISIENGKLNVNLELTEQRKQVRFDSWNLKNMCTGEAGTRECNQRATFAQILPPVISGKISTRKFFAFKYGRIEVRAKLPVGDWLIPEINLEPLHNEYGRTRYGSGLVRVAYVKGNQEFSNDLRGGPVICDSEPYRSMFLRKISFDETTNRGSHWNEDYHNYTLIWMPDGFRLYADGILYGEIEPDNKIMGAQDSVPHSQVWTRGAPNAPFDQMFYISLGVNVGGINDFYDSYSKPWKNSNSKALYKFWRSKDLWYPSWKAPQLIVDYVRVYAL